MHMRLTAVLVIILFSGMALAGAFERSDLTPEDLARVRAVAAPAAHFDVAENFEALSGGAATVTKVVNQDILSFSQANLSFEQEEQFKLGNALFRKLWVAAPSSTQASDGLGPLFNARGCQNCHLKDGRGRPPTGGERSSQSMLLRLSVPPRDAEEQALLDSRQLKFIPEPTYGEQLQDFAVTGLAAEGQMNITYVDEAVTLGDGTVVHLRRPSYAITDLGNGPISPDLMVSPRVAPAMTGLGLLEAIAAEDILSRADPDDADGDGISGKANEVLEPETGELMLGRFGWKAGAATIRSQSAAAFAGDIGISSPLADRPYGDCTPAQAECLAMPTGEQARLGQTEAPDPVLELVTFYSQNLGVPQRRDVSDPKVLAGKPAFYQSGCIACHTPKFVTSRDAPDAQHQFQLIWPYTDLLLHDMGEGLADHRPEGLADGFEWRTPPLWGIGLTKIVSGHTFFLHDGRARSLTEAVLWHGGEAQAARDAFAALPKTKRDALIAFLESL